MKCHRLLRIFESKVLLVSNYKNWECHSSINQAEQARPAVRDPGEDVVGGLPFVFVTISADGGAYDAETWVRGNPRGERRMHYIAVGKHVLGQRALGSDFKEKVLSFLDSWIHWLALNRLSLSNASSISWWGMVSVVVVFARSLEF